MHALCSWSWELVGRDEYFKKLDSDKDFEGKLKGVQDHLTDAILLTQPTGTDKPSWGRGIQWNLRNETEFIGEKRPRDAWSRKISQHTISPLRLLGSGFLQYLPPSSILEAKFTPKTSIFLLKVKVLVFQSCLTLSDPMDCSPPGSSVHGILQARTLPFPSQGVFPMQGSNSGLLHWQEGPSLSEAPRKPSNTNREQDPGPGQSQ